jgi:hypothetical protein
MNRRELELVIATADLAPRLAETQAWRFVVAGHTLQLRTDANAWHTVSARCSRIDCGAATEFAQRAMRSLGQTSTVRVLPRANDQSLLATITEGGNHWLTPTEPELAEMLRAIISRTHPCGGAVMTAKFVSDLQTVAEDRKCWIKVLGSDVVAEVALRLGAGLPTRGSDAFSSTSHIIVLGSDSDDVGSQIRTGRALASLVLTLGFAGFPVTVGAPVADVPGASAVLTRTLSLIGTPQILIAVGTPSGPPAHGLGLDDQVSKLVLSA